MLLCSIFLQLFLIFLGLLLRREETWISSLLFRCRGEAFWSELATLNFYSLEETLCDLGLETWEEAATPPSSVLACPPCTPCSLVHEGGAAAPQGSPAAFTVHFIIEYLLYRIHPEVAFIFFHRSQGWASRGAASGSGEGAWEVCCDAPHHSGEPPAHLPACSVSPCLGDISPGSNDRF